MHWLDYFFSNNIISFFTMVHAIIPHHTHFKIFLPSYDSFFKVLFPFLYWVYLVLSYFFSISWWHQVPFVKLYFISWKKEDKLISLKCGHKVTLWSSINLAFSVRPTYNQGYCIIYELLKKFYLYIVQNRKKESYCIEF